MVDNGRTLYFDRLSSSSSELSLPSSSSDATYSYKMQCQFKRVRARPIKEGSAVVTACAAYLQVHAFEILPLEFAVRHFESRVVVIIPCQPDIRKLQRVGCKPEYGVESMWNTMRHCPLVYGGDHSPPYPPDQSSLLGHEIEGIGHIGRHVGGLLVECNVVRHEAKV